MSIVDELKKLIIAKGGSTAGVQTIAQACKVLVALQEASNEESSDEEASDDDQTGS